MLLLVLGHHQTCPEGFTKDGDECVIGRPVRGECPKDSTYKATTNKCHYNEVHGH